MTAAPWRDTWISDDPHRVCFTCGEPPTSSFRDGSPKYSCPTGPHPPIYGHSVRSNRITIRLTAEQQSRAEAVGEKRFEWDTQHGYRAKWGQDRVRREKRLEQNRNGACGELAACLALGQPWAADVQFRKKGFAGARDMIGDVEVRTAPRDHHKLIVHFEETDDRKHVLVVGQRPQFTIVGWLRGREAARDEWIESWREGGHSFFVPQSALHPIAELQVLLTQEIYDDVPDVLA